MQATCPRGPPAGPCLNGAFDSCGLLTDPATSDSDPNVPWKGQYIGIHTTDFPEEYADRCTEDGAMIATAGKRSDRAGKEAADDAAGEQKALRVLTLFRQIVATAKRHFQSV